MNDVCQNWNMPWHAVQRNIAKRIGTESTVGGDSGRLNAIPVSHHRGAPSVAVSSWLGRPRRGVEPQPTL